MADAYKTFFQVAVPTSVATLGAAVPGAKSWIVMHISIRNTMAGKITVELFKNGTTAAYSWLGVFAIDGNGLLEWDGTEAMAAAEYFAGVAGNAGLYITVSGDEVS